MTNPVFDSDKLQRDHIIALYRKGVALAEIGRRVGKSKSAVSSALYRWGIVRTSIFRNTRDSERAAYDDAVTGSARLRDAVLALNAKTPRQRVQI